MMRIDGVKNVYDAYNSKQVTPNKKVTNVVGRDKVELSSEAKDFASVYKKALEAPDVREQKIADIKSRIDAGTYSVKGEDVADKMMARLDIRG